MSGKLRELRQRARGDDHRQLPEAFLAPFRGTRGLEIGGPSELFRAGRVLPIYPSMATVDCVQFAARTAWHDLDGSGGFVPDGKRLGELYTVDDLDLTNLESEAYDVVFSSHVIEHIANPLRALAAWRRVSRTDGHVLVVAPHMVGTFDHRRPLTSLEHLVQDFERATSEDDLTHLEEVLRLHDRRRDIPFDEAERAGALRSNKTTRLIHHHTFTTVSLGALLTHAGLEVLAAQTRLPHDIFVMARWAQRPLDAGRQPRCLIDAARHSPFRVDRRAAAALDAPS